MRSALLALLAAVVAVAAVGAIRSRPAESPERTAEPDTLASDESGSSPSYLPTTRNETYRPTPPMRPSTQRATRSTTVPGVPAFSPDSSAPRPTRPRRSGPARAPRATGSQVEFLSDALFRQLDANRDGILTGTEIPTELRDADRPRTAIDPETFTKLFQATAERLQANRAAITSSTSAAAPTWFASLAPEKKGWVSLARWSAAGLDVAEFRHIDADGDGLLMRREAQRIAAPVANGSPAARATRGSDSTATAAGPSGGDRSSLNETKPPSKADTLFAHYSAIAAGVAPPRSRGTFMFGGAGALAKSAAAPSAPPAPAPAKPAPKPARPDPGDATLPLPLTGDPYWVKRDTENVTALLAGARADVLFLGDSVADFLARRDGEPLWNDMYAPLGALNFAIGGVTTSQVLWQIETGQVALAAPKVIVLLIGSNNLGAEQKPQNVAAGVEKIVTELGAQLPDTRVLLLGVLPRGAAANDPFRPAIKETNRHIADLDLGDRVTYMDIGSWFVSPDGTISPQVMPDGGHPSFLGYCYYTKAIWETLTDLLADE